MSPAAKLMATSRAASSSPVNCMGTSIWGGASYIMQFCSYRHGYDGWLVVHSCCLQQRFVNVCEPGAYVDMFRAPSGAFRWSECGSQRKEFRDFAQLHLGVVLPWCLILSCFSLQFVLLPPYITSAIGGSAEGWRSFPVCLRWWVVERGVLLARRRFRQLRRLR